MAQKRMIDKKISVSEQVANLGIDGALLFTWLIIHTDDFGLVPYTPRTIKALVVPMFKKYTEKYVGIQLESMWKQGLIEEFEYLGDKFWKFPTFKNTQILKHDRNPQPYFKIELTDDIKKNWKLCQEVMESKRNPVGIQLDTEVKLSKEKLSKGNEISVGEVKGGEISVADNGVITPF